MGSSHSRPQLDSSNLAEIRQLFQNIRDNSERKYRRDKTETKIWGFIIFYLSWLESLSDEEPLRPQFVSCHRELTENFIKALEMGLTTTYGSTVRSPFWGIKFEFELLNAENICFQIIEKIQDSFLLGRLPPKFGHKQTHTPKKAIEQVTIEKSQNEILQRSTINASPQQPSTKVSQPISTIAELQQFFQKVEGMDTIRTKSAKKIWNFVMFYVEWLESPSNTEKLQVQFTSCYDELMKEYMWAYWVITDRQRFTLLRKRYLMIDCSVIESKMRKRGAQNVHCALLKVIQEALESYCVPGIFKMIQKPKKELAMVSQGRQVAHEGIEMLPYETTKPSTNISLDSQEVRNVAQKSSDTFDPPPPYDPSPETSSELSEEKISDSSEVNT